MTTREIDGMQYVEITDADSVPENVDVAPGCDLDNGPWLVPLDQHVEACRKNWFLDGWYTNNGWHTE
jgi:hypothetical protein